MPRLTGGRVDRTPALPGAPRERRVRPLTAMARPDALRDGLRLVGVNPDQRVRARPVTRPDASGRGRYVVTSLPAMAPVHDGRVAAVTGRKAHKRPGWDSVIAGGSSVA